MKRNGYEDYDKEDPNTQLWLNEISNLNYAHGPRTEAVGNPAVVMMVAEKPSIALSIADALSNGNFKQGKGVARQIPVYTFKGTFQGY